jgi:hypothetical protein
VIVPCNLLPLFHLYNSVCDVTSHGCGVPSNDYGVVSVRVRACDSVCGVTSNGCGVTSKGNSVRVRVCNLYWCHV